jgi:hypothetical protein
MAMHRSCLVLAFWLLANIPAAAASPEDLDFVVAASLPPEVTDALRSSTVTGRLVLTSRINPFYLQGDFDGDGSRDTALLARDRSTGKQGIVIVRANGQITVVGAGSVIGNGGDDLEWMDAWYVHRKGKVEQGSSDGVPPELTGDAMMVIKTESASGLIYWNGTKFDWYQQGD